LYSYIKGYITEKTTDSIIIENNGIGYNIYTSFSTISSVKENEKEVKLYTYLYVREDMFSLYGFLTKEEIKMFLLLISVSGVGPKAALSIMSSVTPSKFSLTVITDDVKALTKAQGVGQKLAQRIILELKDKIKKQSLDSNFDILNTSNDEMLNDKSIRDAVEALLVLGYNRESAYNAIKNNFEEGIELENLIKNSLKSLAR
jgi:Holliday junction DNA helicase RuvA